jgi:hypothetical protein
MLEYNSINAYIMVLHEILLELQNHRVIASPDQKNGQLRALVDIATIIIRIIIISVFAG